MAWARHQILIRSATPICLLLIGRYQWEEMKIFQLIAIVFAVPCHSYGQHHCHGPIDLSSRLRPPQRLCKSSCLVSSSGSCSLLLWHLSLRGTLWRLDCRENRTVDPFYVSDKNPIIHGDRGRQQRRRTQSFDMPPSTATAASMARSLAQQYKYGWRRQSD